MIGTAPLSKLTKVPGWETPAEQTVLRRFAMKVPIGGAILEIGSEFGMSASIFRKYSFPDVVIVCVDMDGKAPFMKNLEEVELSWRVHPFYMDSSKFFGYWTALKADSIGIRGYKFDLIFVDGDHTYKGALADLMNVDEFLNDGGFVIIHDTACSTNRNPHPLHYEVSKAVTEWLASVGGKRYQLLETSDSVMVYQKRAADA